MSDPVNLNKYRKAKARADKKARADSNAIAFGTPKSQRIQAQREASREARELDGKTLEKPNSPSPRDPKRT